MDIFNSALIQLSECNFNIFHFTYLGKQNEYGRSPLCVSEFVGANKLHFLYNDAIIRLLE